MLQTVREMFGARKLTADEAFHKLVVDTAEGKPIPEDGVDICVAAGKSVADYENRVATLSARRQAAADLVKAEGMTKDIERLGAAYTKAVEERQALAKKHREEMEAATAKVKEPFDARRSLSDRQADIQRRARIVLHSSADPTIADQIAEKEAEKVRLRNTMNTSAQMKPTTEAEAKERAEWLADLQRQITDANTQIEQLEARRLDPEACVI